MNEQWRGVFGEVRDASFIDGQLIAADRPRRTLRLFVHRAGDGLNLVAAKVLIVAADNALRVDGELKDIVRACRVIFNQCEHTERQPFAVLRWLRCLARRRDLARLFCILLRGAGRVAVDIYRRWLSDDVAAVIVRDGLLVQSQSDRKCSVTRMLIKRGSYDIGGLPGCSVSG